MKCYPNRQYCLGCPNCTQRGAPSSLSTSGGSSLVGYGSISTGRKISHSGKGVFAAGAAQYMGAHLSRPPASKRIWMPGTKAEHKIHGNAPKGAKYDYRPKGTSLRGSFRDSNIGQRGKRHSYRRGEVAEHWARRPNRGGKYSKTSTSQLRSHRKSQARRGAGKVGIGYGMRFLGKGLMVVSLAQYGSWLSRDPSLNTVGQIALDMTGYNLFKPLAEGATDREDLNFNSIPIKLG